MDKAKVDKFLIERIPEGWVDKLFPQGVVVTRGGGDTGRLGEES